MTKTSDAAAAVPPAGQEELLTTKTVAERTNTSEKFWTELRYKGGGPAYIALSRRAVRYRQSDIDAWMGARERRSTFDNAQAPSAQ